MAFGSHRRITADNWRDWNCKEAEALTHKDNRGLRLRGRSAPNRFRPWLTRTVAALLTLTGELLIFTNLTMYRQALPVMAAVGAYICVFYGVLAMFRKHTWFFPAALAVLLGVCLIFHRELGAGYCLFREAFGETLTRFTGWTLTRWEISGVSSAMASGVFAAVGGGAMGLLACFLAAHAPSVSAVLLPVLAMAGMGLLNDTGDTGWFTAVLGISLGLLLCAGWGRGDGSPAIWLGWGVAALAFGALLLASGSPALESWGDQVSRSTRQALHSIRYETADTVLPEGDFTRELKQDTASRPGLRVTMEKPEEMYLRSFAGCDFSGDVWTPISTERLADSRELLFWLNSSAFQVNAQLAAAASVSGGETGQVTVENIGACSENLYISTQIGGGEPLSVENLNPDTVAGFGSRSYSFTAVTGGVEELSRVLDALQDSDDAAVLSYRRAESAYRGFVYDNYLNISPEILELMEPGWQAAAGGYGSPEGMTPQQARDCVSAYLESCFSDGTELPLAGVAGTSYQFATVAALTLRYFGIPARYAEGYVIPEAMAAAAQPGTVMNVTSACAAAWAEVYQDGIGWIPLPLTLGLEDNTDEAPREEPETQPPEELPEEPTQAEAPQGEAQVPLANRTLYVLLAILGVLLVLILVLVLRRKMIRRAVEKRFREPPREAVGWIFADTALLLEAMGFHRGSGSMHTLCPEAGERFGMDYGRRLEAMLRLNERSLFSSREISPQEREDMAAFRQETLTLLRGMTKWYKRFWMKWIRCIY